MKTKIVAEIGCNHMGDLEVARKMIETAALCGADYAKFQKRNNRELLTPEEYDSPHPVQQNSYGNTYGEHRDFLEFTIEQHKELKEHCDAIGIGYACSVWDNSSAMEIARLEPDYIKIPSAMNCHFDLLRCIMLFFPGDIHVSLGMTTRQEEKNIVEFFASNGRLKNLVLYHCTSAYPAPFDALCLLNINRLKDDYPALSIGYSGHNYGIAIDPVVKTLGVDWIERHFTLDRTWKGTDHAASIEPDGLSRIVRDVKATEKALTYRNKNILEIEKEQHEKLKKYAEPQCQQ